MGFRPVYGSIGSWIIVACKFSGIHIDGILVPFPFSTSLLLTRWFSPIFQSEGSEACDQYGEDEEDEKIPRKWFHFIRRWNTSGKNAVTLLLLNTARFTNRSNMYKPAGVGSLCMNRRTSTMVDMGVVEKPYTTYVSKPPKKRFPREARREESIRVPISSAVSEALTPLEKEEYINISKRERARHVHARYPSTLAALFDCLRRESSSFARCATEFVVDEPTKDADMEESILISYFEDLGYKAMADPRKFNDKIRISIS